MTDQERQEWELKLRKMDAEIGFLQAQTVKLATETRWYLLVVGAGFMAAAVAVARVLF